MKRKHRGDSGFTDLYCRGRVLKDDIRCEVCGTLDELSAFLGLARSVIKHKKIKKIIERIQKDLILMSTELVTEKDKIALLKERVGKMHVGYLDDIIEELGNNLPEKFVIFGKKTTSSLLNVARTITRRAERRLVTLKKKDLLLNNSIAIYMNRLSDLLFVLSIYEEQGGKRGGV